MNPWAWLVLLAICLIGPVAAQPQERAVIASRFAHEGSDSTRILSVARSADRRQLGVLFTQSKAGTATQGLSLLSFAARPAPGQTVAIPLEFDLPPGSGHPFGSAGLAMDAHGRAFVALPITPGELLLASANLRTPPAAITRIGTVRLGTGSVDITRLLVAKSGHLVVGGSVDGKGFLAALTPEGTRVWTRTLDAGVSKVLDLIEVDDGWVWVGIVPSSFAAGGLRIGQLDRNGVVSHPPSQPAEAETRFARLTRQDGQLALVYERLRGEGKGSEVYVEVFNSLPGRDSRRRLVFEGELASGFGITPAEEGFVVAGIAAGGVLVVEGIGTDLAVRSIQRTVVKAPEFQRYHSVEILDGEGHFWLAAMESTASGRMQRLELAVSKWEFR